jgi:hypothetical protein
MFAVGGATTGHHWRDDELVERNLRLDINRLHRVGALVPGAVTVWRWPNSEKANVRATHGEIFLSGDRVQSIRFDYLPIVHDCVRPRFFCPGCGRGAYHLHDKAGVFNCRRCCRFDWQCRHRRRYNPFVEKADG